MLTKVQEQVIKRNSSDSLTNVLIPTADGGWRDIYRAGWMPAGFNQQWGGSQWGTEMVDAATGIMHKFDVATGSVEDNAIQGVGSSATNVLVATGFKISESVTPTKLWLKLNKTGNPSDTFQAQIWSDNGSGTPSALLGTLGSLSSRVITSKPDGEWYLFNVTFPAIVAGTQYHIVVGRSGSVDASNYVGIKCTSSKKYPFGFVNTGTTTPTWTASTGFSTCFIIPNTTQLLQTSGQFDGKLVGATSTQPGQTKALCQPMTNFFDGKEFTFLERGNWPVSSTIADFVYGLDHDRVRVFTDASGFANVTLYRQDRTAYTVTGTTSVVAGFHDVAIKARTYGDGADILELWVDGAVQGNTLTGQTFTMDGLMRDQGTAWIGGGFPAAPTWTQDMQMTALPSTQGWAWNGTATEANATSIQNNKLFFNKSGFGATDTGWYTRTSTGLNNTTGWSVEWKCRVLENTNTLNTHNAWITIHDGTKYLDIDLQEYFINALGTVAQFDFKTKENTFLLSGKGSDYYLFLNGRLLIDGTGKLTGTDPLNFISFGDSTNSSGENASVVYSYLKYSTAGMIFPTSTNAGVVQEAAYWSGNKTTNLPALWNAGVPKSLKTYLNLARNYVENISNFEYRSGIVASPSTSSTSGVVIPDMESFIISDNVMVQSKIGQVVTNATTGAIISQIKVDGAISTEATSVYQDNIANIGGNLNSNCQKKIPLGLHKIETFYAVNTGTGTLSGTSRNFSVSTKN